MHVACSSVARDLFFINCCQPFNLLELASLVVLVGKFCCTRITLDTRAHIALRPFILTRWLHASLATLFRLVIRTARSWSPRSDLRVIVTGGSLERPHGPHPWVQMLSSFVLCVCRTRNWDDLREHRSEVLHLRTTALSTLPDFASELFNLETGTELPPQTSSPLHGTVSRNNLRALSSCCLSRDTFQASILRVSPTTAIRPWRVSLPLRDVFPTRASSIGTDLPLRLVLVQLHRCSDC